MAVNPDHQRLTKEQYEQRAAYLTAAYEEYKKLGLQLNMARGKPCREQLDLTMPLCEAVTSRTGYKTEDGTDTRNYGLVDGIPELKEIFAEVLGVPAAQVIVGGNSSLTMMFDYISQAFSTGVTGHEPWSRHPAKFLCPAPGYDRHFAVTEHFGFELVTVRMTETGPDMDQVEKLVKDPSVKGMWCVPMYSNPDGITYSDETVRRLAAMKTGAEDFRIMWDNAYCLHHLQEEHDTLLPLYPELVKRGNEDRMIEFCSTSKISFPGAGVAALGASAANIADIKSRLKIQTIGNDKINMLRHARFFKSYDGICKHMKLHASILRPKFRIVLDTLEKELGGKGVATWHEPTGGYFVSVNVLPGCARETVRLLREAGVVMTGAGATYPYGRDPQDSNIRIAPTFPPEEELQQAMNLFCICAELAAVRKQLGEN